MKIKKICTLLMAVLYCILINNLYHISDLTVLYRGVNSKNDIMLLAAQFLSFSTISFYIFGEAEKHLNGYGKYVLIRRKKRSDILNRIYIKAFSAVLIFEIIKIAIYGIISGISETNLKNALSMFILSILTNLFLISLQLLIELQFNSKSALTATMIYFIISCTAGGIFIKEKIYMPLIILIPNYAMSNRIKYYIDQLNLNYSIILSILLLGTSCLIIAGRLFLKRKDIF